MGRGSRVVRDGPAAETLRDWGHRYNAEGLAAYGKPIPGAKPRLGQEQEAELAALMLKGPRLAEHGVVRWRQVDLSRVIEQRFGVWLAEYKVGSLLRRLGVRPLSVRRQPAKQESAALASLRDVSLPF